MKLLSCGMHRGASIEQLRDISNFQNSFIYLWLVYVKPSSLSIQYMAAVTLELKKRAKQTKSVYIYSSNRGYMRAI